MKTRTMTEVISIFTILGLLWACGNNRKNTESKTTTKTPSNKIYEEFKIDYSLQGKTMVFSLKTDLPNDIKAWVTVNRSYWEKGDTTEYILNYMSRQSSIEDWKKPHKILINDEKWRSDLAERQKETAGAGIGFDVDRISNNIEIDAYVPLTNHPYPNFKKKGIIENEIKVHVPIRGKVSKESKYGNYQSLKKGKTYSVSENTPLMPAFDLMNVKSRMMELASGSRITILSTKYKRGTPWYRVKATDKKGNKIGNGWINSIALIGQELHVIK